MPNERSDVSFPLWRKKMDGSMFDEKCTVIPDWVKDNVFSIRSRFEHNSKSDSSSAATIVIIHKGAKESTHQGYVTTSPRGGIPVMRLYFEGDVQDWLKEAFRMTHLRNEERKSRGWNGPTVERIIPFWEFLDIEWDADASTFYFRAWYTQGEVGLDRFTHLDLD
jgi:hypothetical protein